MFAGFERQRIPTRETEIHLRIGGSGPPVLLIHGYPQTHVTWHKVAPQLAQHFTVVVPDLRGYGDSAAPVPDDQHRAYSKRAMAQDLVEVMTTLGFDQFCLAGHDRGGRVAYRLALEHGARVKRLAVLDMVPTLDTAERTDLNRALSGYHWFFLAQPSPLPETLIGHAPDFYVRHTILSWAGKPEAITPEAMAEYQRCFRNPTMIRATCEDYRAGLSVDLAYDRADRAAGTRIRCPVFVLWGTQRGRSYNLVEIWQRWADDVHGQPLECGHFVMEEAPEETAQALIQFFKDA